MTTFKDYPYWPAETIDDVKTQMRQIASVRKDDITVIQNLPNIFISGRKTGRIPTSSADVVNGDKVNDFNWDTGFLYILVDNTGTGEWRRVALSSW